MKIHITILLLLFGILIATGCSEKEIVSDNKINKQEISQISINAMSFDHEEYAIVKAAGSNNPMIFQINSGDVEVNNINYWIDHYLNGELIESIMNMGSQTFKTSESTEYKLYFSTSEVDSNHEMWTLALRQNTNVTSGRYENNSIDFDSTITHPIVETVTGLNKTVDLGMLIRNKGENTFGSSNDVERTIKENKEVYVIRCRFD